MTDDLDTLAQSENTPSRPPCSNRKLYGIVEELFPLPDASKEGFLEPPKQSTRQKMAYFAHCAAGQIYSLIDQYRKQ